VRRCHVYAVPARDSGTVPSSLIFAPFHGQGKFIRKSLKTDVLAVAKLRLGDFDEREHQQAESSATAARGKMTLGPDPHQRVLTGPAEQGFVKEVSGAKRDRVYCARKLLDILEEPAQLKPAANF
jgi:hypothetical protein